MSSFVAERGDFRGFFGHSGFLRFKPGDDACDSANHLRMGPLDDRVIGEQSVDIAQRLEIEKPGDRIAPDEPIGGPHGSA